MKILHWDEMFHPNFGYQINVLPKFQSAKGHDVIIMTSDEIDKHPTFSRLSVRNIDIKQEDMLYEKKYNVKIIRLPIHKVISGRVIYKKGYIQKIKDLSPDIIFCHTNDTLSGIRITQNYKKINRPIVFDNHMLDMASGNKLKKLFRLYFKLFVTPIIKKNKLKVIKTQNDDYVNNRLGIPKELTPFISFGSDTNLFYPSYENRLKFREKYDIASDDFVVIYTGKLTESKGAEFLADTLIEKFTTKKNIVFVIVGSTSGEYGEKVELKFSNSNNRILRFSTQLYTDLPNFYQMADLSIFPRQCSLSFFDAQACGLPVLGENSEINQDRLSHGNGDTFEKNSIENFREKIIKFANMKNKVYNIYSFKARNLIESKYDYKDITKEYDSLLLSEYNRFYDGKYEE